MSDRLWDEVASRAESSSHGLNVERSRERVRQTAEIFTPTKLVLKLIRRVPAESFAPGKKVLDPACGDGQFLAVVKFAKMLLWEQDEESALSDLYGIDIMSENVRLCKIRLGGGTIIVGDSLNLDREVEGQTPEDRQLLQELLGDDRLTLF